MRADLKLPTNAEAAELLQALLGARLQVGAGLEPALFTGDFNGDGRQDLAIATDLAPAKARLRKEHVRFVDVEPWSKTNGKEIDPGPQLAMPCPAIVVLNASKNGWGQPQAIFAFAQCMSKVVVVPRATALPPLRKKGKVPKVKGDTLELSLESGALVRVYWTGKTYSGHGERKGD